MMTSQPFTMSDSVRTDSIRKWLFGLSVFFLTLLISAPSFARIIVAPGNPGSRDVASGITAISGWAYSTEGADVTVKLRLNGETSAEIPCCGPREDVKAVHSDAPLETSYGLLFNYANLPAGVHTIGVEVSADGEETVVVDHAVTVVVPGNSGFLSAVNLDAASASIEGNTIIVSGVTVTDKASGDTETITVDLSYNTGLQSFQISAAQGASGAPMATFDASPILTDVASAIFATYDALHMAARDPEASQDRQVSVDTLREAVYSFIGTSAQSPDGAIALLPAVQRAWRDARIPWERSEAFLFGPVDSDGHDPFLDTWPLNVTDLKNIIASNQDIATIDLADDVQGFHALEYLLFQDKDGKTDPAAIVAGFTGNANERRRAYTRRVVEEFVSHTQALRDSWDPEGGNFEAQLAMAGRGSMTYDDQKSAMQELVNGMIGIADELADAKMGAPLAAMSNTEEESRFSNNSRLDFADNIRSINNVYTGRFEQNMASGAMGVGAFVADQNPALDEEVRAAILKALAAILAIPEPFGESITSHPTAVQAAVDAATALSRSLGKVLSLVNAANFAH